MYWLNSRGTILVHPTSYRLSGAWDADRVSNRCETCHSYRLGWAIYSQSKLGMRLDSPKVLISTSTSSVRGTCVCKYAFLSMQIDELKPSPNFATGPRKESGQSNSLDWTHDAVSASKPTTPGSFESHFSYADKLMKCKKKRLKLFWI